LRNVVLLLSCTLSSMSCRTEEVDLRS